MRVAIYQPQYLPRLHYINRILDSDTFVLLSSAQYTKNIVHEDAKKERHKTFQSDTVIKLANGEFFLTVPVKHKGTNSIAETGVDYSQKWVRQHLQTIKQAYGKSKNFPKLESELNGLLTKQYASLAQLNIATILWGLAKTLDYDLSIEDLTLERFNEKLKNESRVRVKKIVEDYETGVKRPEGRQKGTEWTVAICKALGADEYVYGGTAASGYMDFGAYKENGIEPVQQDWKLNEYPQLFVDKTGFIKNLSVLDLILNVDSNESLNVIFPKKSF